MLFEAAKELQVPVELLREVHEAGKLPVVNFAAGGIATPADAALMMQLGAEGVFVGAGAGAEGGEALGDALTQRFEHSQVVQQLRLHG